jgi:hypothetical protein
MPEVQSAKFVVAVPVEVHLAPASSQSMGALVSKQETNMIKKLELAFLAAVLAVIGVSAPVLAAAYGDDPALTGSGYNADEAIH